MTRQLACAVWMVYAGPKVDGLPTYGWSTGIQSGSDSQVAVSGRQLKIPEPGSA